MSEYTRGKKFLKKTSFRVGMELKKVIETRRGLESIKNPTPLRNDAGPLSGLQCNALASLVHFVTYTTKRTRDASALRWRPQRGTVSFHSWGRVLEAFSSPPCFYTFFSSIPTRNEVFFRNFFPLVSVLFWGGGGVCKPIFKYSSFHLQIWYHTADKCVIASDEIASATHLQHDITL